VRDLSIRLKESEKNKKFNNYNIHFLILNDMKKTAYRIKQLTWFSIFAILFALTFVACDEDDSITYPNPTISLVTDVGFVSTDSVIGVGQTFTVVVHAEWNGQHNLTNIIAKLNGDNYLDLGIFAETYDREIELTKGLEDTEEWEFIIRDIEGNSASVSLTITKDPNISYGEIDEFLNVQLGAQNSIEYGSFLSFNNGLVYNLESAYNNQEIINMAYVYDNYDDFEESVITSPGANVDDAYIGQYGVTNWEIRNTIRYSRAAIDVSVEDFDAAANDSILIANSFGYESGGRKTKFLAPDDIYSFVTDDNRTGLFKVVSTSGTDNGYIILDIKLEK